MSVRRQRERGNYGQEPLFWFLKERKSEAGQTGLELANLNNFNRLCSIDAIPGCLIPGPRAIRAGVQWPGVWEPWEVVGGVDLIGYSGKRNGQPLL